MKKNRKTFKGLTLKDVKQIRKIIFKGLKYSGNGEKHATIIKLAKSIALQLHLFRICIDFFKELEKKESSCFNSSKCSFKKLKKYSEKCSDLWLSTALESLSNL